MSNNADDVQPELSDEPTIRNASKKKRNLIYLSIFVLTVAAVLAALWVLVVNTRKATAPAPQNTTPQPTEQAKSTESPQLKTEVVLAGRQHVWEIAFLPTKEMVFTERTGAVSIQKDGQVTILEQISDVQVRGEGGLMGLAVDPEFNNNRFIYTCFNTTAGDIKVVRWGVNLKLTELETRKDLVTGIPANPSGRHSGCRIGFGPDGYLWIGTGDTAQNMTPQTPQAPKSLAGKILRVDRVGTAAPGNLTGDFDKRIYSYGHRNTQGLAFFTESRNGVPGISVEHGSDVDDEVNLLKKGNFGWAPPDGPYDESVPMTDKKRFPDAVEAIWSSGRPTQAPAGAAILRGSAWKAWEGAIAMAMLKDQQLKMLMIDDNFKVTKEEKHLEKEFGRLRAVALGPNGSLYIGSSNGTDDKIIRLTPQP